MSRRAINARGNTRSKSNCSTIAIRARILHAWADLYSARPRGGQDHGQLKPTHAIWLPGDNLFDDSADYARDFQMRDRQGTALLDHGGL